MKLYFSKFLMAAAMIGAVALTGCSDGNSDPITVKTNYGVTLDGTPVNGQPNPTIATAAKYAAALAGTSFTVPSGGLKAKDNTVLPAGTVLTFKAGTAPAGDTKFVTNFILKVDNVEYPGYIDAGSCIFNFNPGVNYFGKTSLVYEPCSLTLNTAGMIANPVDNQPRTFDFQMGSVTIPVTVLVTITSAGVVKLNGVQVGTVSLTSGASGGGN